MIDFFGTNTFNILNDLPCVGEFGEVFIGFWTAKTSMRAFPTGQKHKFDNALFKSFLALAGSRFWWRLRPRTGFSPQLEVWDLFGPDRQANPKTIALGRPARTARKPAALGKSLPKSNGKDHK